MHYDELRWKVPERKKLAAVYDNHRLCQNMIFDIFKKSYWLNYLNVFDKVKYQMGLQEDYTIDDLTQYVLPTYHVIKPAIPESIYTGLTVCNLPVEEVGCGIIATAQGLTQGYKIPTRECFEEICSVIEEKDYYFVGRGLYWHWFDNFCTRISHWYDLVESVKYGIPVTVLIKREGDTRNHFTNLIGTINTQAVREGKNDANISSGDDYKFITTEGDIYSLNYLMKIIQTAPWKWVD